MFRVITRKLVEQRQKKADQEQAMENITTPSYDKSQPGYFDGPGSEGNGSFKVGIGDKRRSWLGFPTPSVGIGAEDHVLTGSGRGKSKRGKCC